MSDTREPSLEEVLAGITSEDLAQDREGWRSTLLIGLAAGYLTVPVQGEESKFDPVRDAEFVRARAESATRARELAASGDFDSLYDLMMASLGHVEESLARVAGDDQRFTPDLEMVRTTIGGIEEGAGRIEGEDFARMVLEGAGVIEPRSAA